MSVAGILVYLLKAALYALPVAGLYLAGHLLWRRRPPRPERLVLVFAAGFVVFLGLHPFPLPDAVACKPLLLDPRDAAAPYLRLWRNDAPLSAWLRDPGVLSVPMNFVFFAAVGAALALNTDRLGAAVALGCGLSGFIELSQVTGLYGVYPCPYRTFDTADLVLNVAGVVAGFAALRALRRRQRQRRATP